MAAVNVTLLNFAADRCDVVYRAAAVPLLLGTGCAAIDQTDRQTDGKHCTTAQTLQHTKRVLSKITEYKEV